MDKRGIFIDFEGPDGAGKSTQSRMLFDRLKKENFRDNMIYLKFPTHNQESGLLADKYLEGLYPYNESFGEMQYMKITSTLFSVDRAITMLKKDDDGECLKEKIDKGAFIISDRYTGSNILHQTAYLSKITDVLDYSEWIKRFEYNALGIPKPDLVLYLDVDKETTLKAIKKRFESDPDRIDVHETEEFVNKIYKRKALIIQNEKWIDIPCCDENGLLPVELIHNIIYTCVMDAISRNFYLD